MLKKLLALAAPLTLAAMAATAAPVEYVRVCNSQGAGMFYVPGTDTCVDAAQLHNLPALGSGVTALNSSIAGLNSRMNTMQRGLAAGTALTTAPMPSAVGRTTYSVNLSGFLNNVGAGGSIAHRVDFLGSPLAVTAGFGTAGGRAILGRVGLAGEF